MARIGDRGEMEAFVRSAELGSFSAAARELGLTPSALSKLVDRLEMALQVRLLNRTTRKLHPTAEGELFLVHCRRILSDIEAAESELIDAVQGPRGKLRIHAGVGFATHQLVPALPRFVARYPEVTVDLLALDQPVDITKEGVDISVWPGPPLDEGVVARKLCDVERVLCASPDYLARFGVPHAPEDLLSHQCITLSGLPSALAPWTFERPACPGEVVAISGSVHANNAECVRQIALNGLGIARLNEFIVEDDIRHGRLLRVLADIPCGAPMPLYALHARSRHRLRRVAVMLEFLTESFGPQRLASSRRQA
jgi:DNA-binding transcriptional LysR family regulator